MSEPVIIEDKIKIPHQDSPIYVSLVSGTPSDLRYRMELEQPPLPNKPIGGGQQSGEVHLLGSPTQLLMPRDRLVVQSTAIQTVPSNTDYDQYLAFFQDGKVVAKSKHAADQYSDSVAWVEIVFLCTFQ